MPKPKLGVVNTDQPHARDLAKQAVTKWRKGTVVDHAYDFNAQPREQREIFYRATVRFHCQRSWWARLRGWLRW